MELLNYLSIACLILGCLCNLIAGIGLFYFPDVYTRMHATGVTDTLGAGLILIGLMFHSSWDGVLGKLLLILLFTLLTSPTITYVLANTAQRNRRLSKKLYAEETVKLDSSYSPQDNGRTDTSKQ